MNLEINKKHKKVKLINLKNKNQIFSSIMSGVLAITLFSGCTRINNEQNEAVVENDIKIEETLTQDLNETQDIKDNIVEIKQISDVQRVNLEEKLKDISQGELIEVPDSLKPSIVKDSLDPLSKKITIEYLENIRELRLTTFNLTSPDELLWLNYCKNLESLQIIITNDNILREVYELPNLKKLILINCGNKNITLDVDSSILLTSPNLVYLKLNQINIEDGLIEQINQIKVLDIQDNDDLFLINFNIDYTKLTNLQRIIISNPYSVIIHLDTEELNQLINNGVIITDKDGNDQTRLLQDINNQIDSIINNLNINENSTKEEIVQEIVLYTLEALKYDQQITELIESNQVKHEDTKEFYNNGYLYGALETDSSICGNYSSLIATLCDRFNINGRIQISMSHAWNIVYLNGDNYYIDATILDEGFNNSEDSNLYGQEWYLKDPNDVNDLTHKAINIPDILTIRPIENPITIEEESYEETYEEPLVNDISNKNYVLVINNKVYIISSVVMIGILSGLGYAYKSKEKYDKQEKQESKGMVR